MRIVTLGAGTVGTWIAEELWKRGHEVTVVDNNPEHVGRINDELDVKAITGSASQSSVLFQADVIGCDMCLAVTGNDEVNIVAASMAKAMGARLTIARVYAPVFHDPSTFDYQRDFGIDRLLSLEQLSATELARKIRNPGSVVVEQFARGQLDVQEVQVTMNIDVPLKKLDLPRGVLLGSIHRDGRMWIAGAEDRIRLDDRITLIGRHEVVDQVKDKFQREPGPKQGVVIAGGGETGFHLARTLEGERFSVKLMEEDKQRCEYLAKLLERTTVVHADATRSKVLEEERVGSADVFVACTGDDENNIMACVEAKEIGAKRIMAIVGRPDYANVVGKLGVDVAVSGRDVVARQVIGLLNKGAVISRTTLPGGNLGVFEIKVLDGALVTEHVLANVQLPSQCLIAAVSTEGFVRVPGGDDRLGAGDTVVALIDESVKEEALLKFNAHTR